VVEPEPQRDAAPAPTAPNLMFNNGRLSNMSQAMTISYFSSFPIQFYTDFNH
jgi:hypothetical protein